MSWVNDLVVSAGLPTGAATIAVGLYGACAAAEASARPQALTDIATVLRSTSWSNDNRPSAIIARVFRWTFGDRHLSWKCLGRSILASLIFLGSFVLMVYVEQGTVLVALPELNDIYPYLFVWLLPDYLAL